ncbi:hypothetical protein D3C85_1230240 [compost metagenome]
MPAQTHGQQAVIARGQQAKEAALIGARKTGEPLQVIVHSQQRALLPGHIHPTAQDLHRVEVS